MQKVTCQRLIYFDMQVDFWIVPCKLINRYYCSCFLRVRVTLSSLLFYLCAIYQYSCAKDGKRLKIGTKGDDTIWIDNRLGDISID